MIRFTRLLALPALFLVTACENECRNTNPVFDREQPGTAAYNNELTRQILSGKDVDYHLEGYEEKDLLPYVHVRVAGDGICATAVVLVLKRDDKIDGIVNKKGLGYIGAGLDDFTMVQDNETGILIYEDMKSIID